MATMIAARLHAYDHAMRLERIPIPEPRPTEVLVEIRACGIVPNLPPLPAIFGLDPTRCANIGG
jgi:hypothetical protein